MFYAVEFNRTIFGTGSRGADSIPGIVRTFWVNKLQFQVAKKMFQASQIMDSAEVLYVDFLIMDHIP